MTDYGIKVSQSGEDVKTASDSKLMFSSSILTNPVKEVVSISMASSPYTYSHGLSFAPKAWIFYDEGTYWKRVPFELAVGLYIYDMDYEIDATDITIRADSGLLTATLRLIVFTREVTD
ncbi:hypothetical protein AKJ59_00605 [candidate division MSBL1 archaeon SCGC-AAA385M02]|uniref:Uncharacterized protein n=1 Tax=candidate division MSBL1 archaeon SCGC-AAA385M02 TaxID=1698287 RepID=A0A133VQI5_9EURY|nr:hypothetical protein AKJ59_00605 [candidate division MSBL1 archaeon SCGC-AAA385M02]